MKKHLSALSVERIKPPKQGVLEVFDLGYPGLALRVGFGGAKSFCLFYREHGKLTRKSLGRWPETSLNKARDEWRRTRESIANGVPIVTEKTSNALLFEQAVEEWMRKDQSKNKANTVYQVGRAVDTVLIPAWRGRRIDQLTKADVYALLDGIKDRGSPIMARRVQTNVRRFFGWCTERGMIPVNPVASMERVAQVKSRERVLCDKELAEVWSACDGMFGLATRLLILTGARREEIGQLKWSEIDGDTIVLEGDRTKNGEAHIIPLSTAAKTLLASVPRIANSPFVFSVNGRQPISGWGRAKARLDDSTKIADWRLHDLRRTTATGLQRLGVNLQVVESVLGHTAGSRGGIVGVYQRHNFADEKRAALEAWGNHVASLVL